MKPIIIGEIGFNLLFIMAWLYLAVLFFSKKRAFPPTYIALQFIGLAFLFIDALVVGFAVPEEPMFDPDTVKGIARSLVGICIWVPYMLVSQRVKNTFVE